MPRNKIANARAAQIMLVKERIDGASDARCAYDVSNFIEEPKTEPHQKAMHWTGCYDDYCNAHKSDKQAGGHIV